MTAIQVVAIVLAAAAGTAVVLTRELRRLVVVNGVFALALTVLFVVLQAPDVALSMVVVGSVAYPFVLLTALTIIRRAPEEDDR